MIKGYKHLKCGLIGGKLGHSFSPMIHRELADYSYRLFEICEDELFDFLKNGDFDRLNVTIPYKKSVIPYLDRVSDEARKIGAVNTIVRRDNGELWGDNTDYYGFSYLLDKGNVDVRKKKIIILGTGGAASTAKAVCRDRGADSITEISRSGEINYLNIYDRCADCQVIINCTPVGMYPNNMESPVCLDLLPNCKEVVDMIYNPAKTKLLLDAKDQNINHIGGLYMLVAQAKRACEIFTGSYIADGEITRISNIISARCSNIVLVGMPGCGKSTVANILSGLTGRDVLDTDNIITETEGRSIPEIFASDGEKYFRDAEHKAARTVGCKSGKIIATGGGIVTVEENYPHLTQNGKIFFIHRSVDSLEKSGRPLSQTTDLWQMYQKRLPLYRRFCDFEVSNDTTPDECARQILTILGKESNV